MPLPPHPLLQGRTVELSWADGGVWGAVMQPGGLMVKPGMAYQVGRRAWGALTRVAALPPLAPGAAALVPAPALPLPAVYHVHAPR